MLAKDVMTTGVITVLEDTPVREIARTLLNSRISGVPVVDTAGHMVGIVSEGDLVRRTESGTEREGAWWLSHLLEPDERAQRFAKAHGRLAKDVMTTDVVTADENDSLSKLAETLEKNGIKRIPVLRKGHLIGIVSRANLLHGLAASPRSSMDATAEAEQVTVTTRRGPIVDDAAIRATILNRLHNEVGIDRVINVIVTNGVVDLWGCIETEAERQAVRAVAENASNVSAVKDHMSVLPEAFRHLLGAHKSD